MYQKFYSHFLKANSKIQHYAAHSHHFWPDVTLKAVNDYWSLACEHTDKKWDIIFGKTIPDVQKLIAKRIHFSQPENICFSPNTHDFVVRLISSLFKVKKKIKILTSDSEFYSFQRQVDILEQAGLVEITRISTQPFVNLSERLLKELDKNQYDLLFISHVFFNSGVVLKNLEEIAELAENKKTVFVLDGYHSFMALPIDLNEIENKMFFIAGSYKYAQAGEGCCFMTIPEGYLNNPLISGWFGDFKNLEKQNEKITYSSDGYKFAGSTMDYSTLFKLKAVLELFEDHFISDFEIHSYIKKLQNNFLNELYKKNHPLLNIGNLLHCDLENHGHFLAFEFPDVETCVNFKKQLELRGIITDSRKNILRFGFGLYQNEQINLIL